MIEVKNLDKSWNGKRAVEALSFTVGHGEVYGLLGPNGSGKTTTFRVLSGLAKADRGEVRMDGVSQVGLAAQEIAIYRDLTVRENLVFFARVEGLPPRAAADRAARILETFSFAAYADALARHLSGGWQRRLHVAIALVNDPGFLILDEPTAGLDVEGRWALWDVISRVKRSGTSVLLTTHDLLEAERVCDRIGILEEGRLVAEGTLDELRRLVPAASIAQLEGDAEIAIEERARELGLETRRYGGKLAVWLPRRADVAEVVELFDGIRLTSASVSEVGLEHVFRELSSRLR